MAFIHSIFLAFSMFSTLPMPRTEWNARNMRYLMCAFPLVGLLIGALVVAWNEAFLYAPQWWHRNVSPHVQALGMVLIPLALTGGIHLDGLLDTVDALASHADRQKKLEILADSHVGAFAVMACAAYLLACYVLAEEYAGMAKGHAALICPASAFVLSRLLSALAVATFPIAKDSGLVRTFADSSARRFCALCCGSLYLLLSAALLFFFRRMGLAVMVASALAFAWYYCMTRRNFGGITGDTAGCFVQICELACLAATDLALWL